MSEQVRRRVIVHGMVQGVFFRDSTRRRAASLGVAGWVRNRPDGTVEAVFEGEREAVEEPCRRGPATDRGAPMWSAWSRPRSRQRGSGAFT